MKINKFLISSFILSMSISMLSPNQYVLAESYKEERELVNLFNIFKTNKGKNERIPDKINTWETGFAPMSIRRDSLTAQSVDDKIYVIGGYSRDFDGQTNLVEEYDADLDKWTVKTPMPTVRDSLGSAVVDGKIYCIGGWNGGSVFYSKVEVYDPKTDKWETKAPMPTARYGLGCTAVGSKIYCVGGYTSSGKVATLEVYDTKTDTWETKASMPTSRSGLTATSVGEYVYAIGGGDANDIPLKTVERYNIKENKWETMPSMTYNRRFLSSITVMNKIYVIGGFDNFTRTDKVEEYDPATNTWTTKANMLIGRSSIAVAEAKGKIYCIGGTDVALEMYKGVDVYTAAEPKVVIADRYVVIAENSKDIPSIDSARDVVNKLPESPEKEILQDRLNNIILPLGGPLVPISSSANTDIYIKPKNKLSVTLDTNYVVFDDYAGIDEMEKLGAIKVSVESSLPYTLKASLPIGIQGVNTSTNIDTNTINIRENTQGDYKTFYNVLDEVILKDTCLPGVNEHNIDIKLSGSKIFKTDVYKTVLKFEIEQK